MYNDTNVLSNAWRGRAAWTSREGADGTMEYDVQFKPRAVKDIKRLPTRVQSRILAKVEEMSDNLKGDVKRLSESAYEYRLRVGDYRVLFEVEGKSIVIYRIRHRREAYR
jgi:mRNA interferase RelE/StbE